MRDLPIRLVREDPCFDRSALICRQHSKQLNIPTVKLDRVCDHGAIDAEPLTQPCLDRSPASRFGGFVHRDPRQPLPGRAAHRVKTATMNKRRGKHLCHHVGDITLSNPASNDPSDHVYIPPIENRERIRLRQRRSQKLSISTRIRLSHHPTLRQTHEL